MQRVTRRPEIQRPSNNTTRNLKQKKNISWAPVNPAADESSEPHQLKWIAQLKVGAIKESDARPIGMQFKSASKLLTAIRLITKHADCHTISIVISVQDLGENLSFLFYVFLNGL